MTSGCLTTKLHDVYTTIVRENVLLFDFYLTHGSESLSYTGLKRRLALLKRVKMQNTLSGVQEIFICEQHSL